MQGNVTTAFFAIVMELATLPMNVSNMILIIMMKGTMKMNVYLKNNEGEQTVRYLPIMKALWLRFIVFAKYKKEDRPIVRFVI